MLPCSTIYFPIRGLCEAMRTLLADRGQSWKEEAETKETWLQGPVKASCLYRQLPKIQDRDLTLHHLNAILHLAGHCLGLHGVSRRQPWWTSAANLAPSSTTTRSRQ